ncbi:MAG: hypothetical protein A2X12_03515 [Bacteroidetes bacterium GWE2_29_8]|nr:MAG: hypothetical protein A2X12_03515 [Bacteroidetes bacterium GWE2_29_8]OFY16435.1 MAG: hypothetical protein A2X02_02730 [Bacteroidetes bacterium GWF2_29_10]
MKVTHLIILFIIFQYSCFSQDLYKEVSEKKLFENIKYLSKKELGGRLSGSIGYEKALQFAEKQFKSYGLKSERQNFLLEFNDILKPAVFQYENEQEKMDFKIGKDYILRCFSGSGNLNTDIVFCGYGISNHELGYDDYFGIDVKGKVVIVFKQNPEWEINDTTKWTAIYPRDKALIAFSHGAIGIIFVSKPNDANPQSIIGSSMENHSIDQVNIPQIHATIETINKIFESNNFDIKALQSDIDKNKTPKSFALKGKVKININTNYVKQQPTSNLYAIIEGSDSLLKNEYLILGAHLDHVGVQAEDVYFPGANDNASGSATILELARVFSLHKIKPKRSIIFVLFAAEENGMLGSKYFAENCPVPVKNVVSMFNFDCIAHGDSILVRCGELFPELWNIAKENNKYINMMVDKTTNSSVADAEAFFKEGIPTLYFVTTNTYTHLHLQTDTPETINKQLHRKITQLAYLTTLNVANTNKTFWH